jgi:hypothetical protein
MADLVPMPARGEVFLDARGGGRALRLSWHHEAEVVVLSLWQQDTCMATFRFRQSDVPAFVDALASGLRFRSPRTGSRRHADAG